MDIGTKLAQLEKRLEVMERSSRLSHASLDDTALQVYDGGGGLRAVVGQQGDGTTAVTVVNGPPPPQPSPPIAASVLGGVTVSWDGRFDGGAVIPMDWARIEVHASTTSGFAPDASTLQSTIETAQGATVVVPTDDPVYVLLLARNTSGAASTPTAQAGPLGPTPVVASGLLDGIVTTVKLADDAVTAAKVAVGAIDEDALAAAAVTAGKIGADAVTAAAIATGAVGATEISDGAITTPKLTAGAVTANELTAGAVTAGKIAAGAVTAGKIDAAAVTAGNIAASAVQAGNLAAGSVQAGNIAADSVQAGNIAASAVTARELNALAVTAGKIDANAVTAGTIAAGAVNATSLTVGLAQSVAQKLTDAMAEPSVWSQVSGTGTTTWLTGVTDAAAGATVMQANGYVTMERTINIPYDPDALYKITVRVRVLTAPTSGGAIALGLTGIAADGATRVNTAGANSTSLQYFVAASGVTVAAGAAWTTYTGYIQGTAASGTGTACADPKAPGKAQSAVRYVRPIVRLLLNSTDGVAQVDQVTSETVPTGVVNSVNISNGAVTADALNATAITGKTITGGTVTGATVQTGTTGQRIALESSTGEVRLYRADGSVATALTPVGPRNAPGLVANSSSGSYVQLAEGELAFGGGANMFTQTGVSAFVGTAPQMVIASGQRVFSDSGVRLLMGASSPTARPQIQFLGDGGKLLTSNFDGDLNVGNIFSAGSIAYGTITITTSAANTPTSGLVSGLSVKGSTFRAYLTASSGVPGTQMLGVTATNVTSSGMTVWITRTNTSSQNTAIFWQIVGV
ncbi:hypothetical protein [Streptomyces sp. NPDC088348]|uniref:hypothetical protein n=1 Tax=Streptomyces sp. NPDC088348 TaxID=3365853 RepID=UPI0037F29915